jgi:hypothetical protein
VVILVCLHYSQQEVRTASPEVPITGHRTPPPHAPPAGLKTRASLKARSLSFLQKRLWVSVQLTLLCFYQLAPRGLAGLWCAPIYKGSEIPPERPGQDRAQGFTGFLV